MQSSSLPPHEVTKDHQEVLDALVQHLSNTLQGMPRQRADRAIYCLLKAITAVCAAQDLEAAQFNSWAYLKTAWDEAGLPHDMLKAFQRRVGYEGS